MKDREPQAPIICAGTQLTISGRNAVVEEILHAGVRVRSEGVRKRPTLCFDAIEDAINRVPSKHFVA